MSLLLRLFERRLFVVLAALSLGLAGLDYLGIGLVLPFVQLVGSGDGAKPRIGLGGAGLPARVEFLCGLFIGLFLLKTVVAVLLRRRISFLLMTGQRDLIGKMVSLVLNAEYRVFLEGAPSTFVNTIYSLSVHATECLYALVDMVTESVLLVLLFVLALWLDPRLTVICAGVLVVFGLFLRFAVLAPMRCLGEMRNTASLQWYRLSHCVITAIRDIKIMNLESTLQAGLDTEAARFTGANARYLAIQSVPKLVGEFIAVAAIIAAVGVVAATGANLNANLAVLAAFGAILTRTAPAVHRLYNAVSHYRYCFSSVQTLEDTHAYLQRSQAGVEDRKVCFRSEMRLDRVTVSYPGTASQALSDVSLVIPRGGFVAVVGRSGSGKSTLLDVLAGLLKMDHGRLLVDGQEADPFRCNSVRRLVGYVPQQVTLFDGSMGYNIALDPQYRNSTDRVREAARAASIDGFIESLPGGYEASVGEGGGRMSGGQRQRMGIARALYKGPELLLFDEATSAVDAITEEDIMRSIREISGRCTVVFVTHRLRSIQRCGSIIVLDEGRVVGAGTHESLLAGCPVYRALYAGDDEGHVPGRAAAGVPDSGPRRSAAGLPPDLPGAGFGRTT